MRAIARAFSTATVLGVLLAAAPPLSAEPVERTIAVAGANRAYLVHVPSTWDRTKPIPVLFVFHGAGSDAESMVRATGFDATAETTNLLVVYPRAPAPDLRYDVDPPAGRVSADVLFFDAILARLRERFPIDPARIYATGFSNGAAFCYRLAAERADVVAAIAPVAGYLPSLRAAASEPTPVIHVHGTADDRVPAPGAPSLATSAVAGWARRNGVTTDPTVTTVPGTGRLAIRRASFRGATPRADADLLLVEGEGHTWSGGPQGPVSRAILEFLMAHPRDTTPAPKVVGNHPLVGQPFGATDMLRWSTPDGAPFSLGARPLTLFRWFTNECPHCRVSVPPLAALEARHRDRGLRFVAVYHPKGAALSDEGARAYAKGLSFEGTIAFDDRWTKYIELRDRGGLTRATSISVLVDEKGVIRWVHPGPRIEAGSADLAELEALVDALLPPRKPAPAAR